MSERFRIDPNKEFSANELDNIENSESRMIDALYATKGVVGNHIIATRLREQKALEFATKAEKAIAASAKLLPPVCVLSEVSICKFPELVKLSEDRYTKAIANNSTPEAESLAGEKMVENQEVIATKKQVSSETIAKKQEILAKTLAKKRVSETIANTQVSSETIAKMQEILANTIAKMQVSSETESTEVLTNLPEAEPLSNNGDMIDREIIAKTIANTQVSSETIAKKQEIIAKALAKKRVSETIANTQVSSKAESVEVLTNHPEVESLANDEDMTDREIIKLLMASNIQLVSSNRQLVYSNKAMSDHMNYLMSNRPGMPFMYFPNGPSVHNNYTFSDSHNNYSNSMDFTYSSEYYQSGHTGNTVQNHHLSQGLQQVSQQDLQQDLQQASQQYLQQVAPQYLQQVAPQDLLQVAPQDAPQDLPQDLPQVAPQVAPQVSQQVAPQVA
ncbi:hypothetical protein EBY67_06890, partial [bacterium]|nr:hypothetical protein [bacterium]